MKSLVLPSDVVGVGTRGKENTWKEVFVVCQIGIFICDLGLILIATATAHIIKEVVWIVPTDNTPRSTHRLISHREARKLDSLFYKRHRHKISVRDRESCSVLTVKPI